MASSEITFTQTFITTRPAVPELERVNRYVTNAALLDSKTDQLDIERINSFAFIVFDRPSSVT